MHILERFSAWVQMPMEQATSGETILQLMPATARRFGVRNLFDATQHVEGGARYLRWLLDRFEGDPRLALAGYNAGEGAVDRHRGVPPYRETRSYVVKVLDKAGAAGADK